jgi:hypothetical protein
MSICSPLAVMCVTGKSITCFPFLPQEAQTAHTYQSTYMYTVQYSGLTFRHGVVLYCF